MYKIAVCDDDIHFSSIFEKMLSKTLDKKGIPFQMTLFSDISSLQHAVESGDIYDLLFLDIIFETEKGICFARFLKEINYNADIIFISSNPEYGVESYDVSPLHYLVKPIEQEKLDAALNRFLDRHASRILHFTTSKGLLNISLSDILFFEIYSHEIIIHKTDGTKETCAGTLKKLEALLPPFTFVRPHRSYLVNLDHISYIVRYQIHLSSGTAIPVSKNLYQNVQSQFIDYAEKKCISF